MRLAANKKSRLLSPERRASVGGWQMMDQRRTSNPVTLQNKLAVSVFWNTTQHTGRVEYVLIAVSLQIQLSNEPTQARRITKISSTAKVREGWPVITLTLSL